MLVCAEVPALCHAAVQWERYFPSRAGSSTQVPKVPDPRPSLAPEGRQ